MRKTKLKLLASVIGIISLLGLAVAGCVSPTALSVAISSPEDGATVSESPITVTGTVSGYPRGEVTTGEQTARVAPEVTVNGIRADVDANGGFSAQVELTEGENIIEAVAMLNNVEARDSITVTYAPSAPALSIEITSPEDGAELTESPTTVTGTVSDAEATVTIFDQAVEVAADGSFSAQVELTEGENTIEAVATLGEEEARDSITVIFAPAVALSIEVTSPQDGAELTESPVTVTGTVSDNTSAVTVNGVAAEVAEDGTFSAQVELTEGENTIEAVATLGEQEARASITVTFSAAPAPTLISIAVEPASPADLAIGATQQFTATGTYSDGSTADITSQVTWVSSDTGVATIDAAGLATGVAAGTTDITASLSGVTSPAVTLTVVAP